VLASGPPLLRSDLPDDLARILVASAVSGAAALTGERDLLDEAAVVGGLTADRLPTVIPGFGLADLQVLGHRLAGTADRGDDQVRRMLAASADLPGPARLMGLVVAGHAAIASGRVTDALLLLREAWAGLADSKHEFRFRCRTLLATALGQSGEAETGGPLLSGIRAGPHPAYLFLTPDDLLAQAWGAAGEGSTSEALDHAVAAAEVAREMGAPSYEVLAWQTVVQLGEAASALPRLTSLADLGPRALVAGTHARALADSDAESLLGAAESWSRLGDLVAAGDAALARALAARSGARTPALAIAVQPLPLTAREREIVALAARGLSNNDIAERLTVSVRTVEGHLYRAGLKLGVSERTALAHVLGVE
jgi:DNA-binding CsgD family transcriptional regulator